MSSIYKDSWALPTPGLRNKAEGIDTKLRTLPEKPPEIMLLKIG